MQVGTSFLPSFRGTTTHEKGEQGDTKHTNASALASCNPSTSVSAPIHIPLATTKSPSLPLTFTHSKHEPKRYRTKAGQLK